MIGKDVDIKDVDIPQNVGVIIETPGFLPNYSGFNNLKFLAKIKNKIGVDVIKNAISSVGLNPDDKKHVGKYPLGMRQYLLDLMLYNNTCHLFLKEV